MTTSPAVALEGPAFNASQPLRERNRLLRWRTIHIEGMRLFAERGYESTTVADVADAAGLSPRTVTIYFPAKLDIAMASTTAAAERLLLKMSEAGPHASTSQVMTEWMRSEYAAWDPEIWALRGEMFAANPQLSHAHTPQQEAVGLLSTRLLARDLGVAPGHPAVALASGAFAGALTSFVIVAVHHEPNALINMTSAAFEGLVASLRTNINRTDIS